MILMKREIEQEMSYLHVTAKEQLHEWVEQIKEFSSEGKTADYIPALKDMDSSQLGICLIGADGTVIQSGDYEAVFTLQSISKVISFIAACLCCGIPYVLERVDVEPTGDAFNSIIRLEMHKPGKPFNPMINAGALTVSSLLSGETAKEKLSYLFDVITMLTGKTPLINETVFESEWQTSHRNRALAYYLKETNYLQGEVEEVLEVYLKQCSIEVTTEDIALIGLILSLDGYHPVFHKQVIPKEVAKLTKALMLTCGMYNASGKFAAFVGMPAKSGVSGGIMSLVPPNTKKQSPFPDGCGIGIYSPAIDEYGNSVKGVTLLKKIAKEWDLSIF